MTDLLQLLRIVDAIILPMVAMSVLFLSKVSYGCWAKWAERQFFTVLAVMTLATLRTVIHCDDAWLIHTATLGFMIVAALYVPAQTGVVT
ncbi:hypothetical protein [Novipirellula artificiosorum]|uniref:Uncharacterized protein n=1 Tax=Novipirellula artificiosorum TaxID=2528016 RepID=A0A5C6DC65_9BACT|nr:hypothetical protein [Novipirellula artificiosorum]TWU32806.1 hypothetical protein Poly41_51830 [Novipirellula artificiosorum]